MKKYNAFASQETKDMYICKSQITRSLLNDLNLPNNLSLEYAKSVFEDCILKGNSVWVYTGSQHDNNKRRLTPFVLKLDYYKEFVKGLSHPYKKRKNDQ